MTWNHNKLVKMAMDFERDHPADADLDTLLLLNERREGRTDEPSVDYEQTGRDLELALLELKPGPTIDSDEAILALQMFAEEFKARRAAERAAAPKAPPSTPPEEPPANVPKDPVTAAKPEKAPQGVTVEQDEPERDDDDEGPER